MSSERLSRDAFARHKDLFCASLQVFWLLQTVNAHVAPAAAVGASPPIRPTAKANGHVFATCGPILWALKSLLQDWRHHLSSMGRQSYSRDIAPFWRGGAIPIGGLLQTALSANRFWSARWTNKSQELLVMVAANLLKWRAISRSIQQSIDKLQNCRPTDDAASIRR